MLSRAKITFFEEHKPVEFISSYIASPSKPYCQLKIDDSIFKKFNPENEYLLHYYQAGKILGCTLHILKLEVISYHNPTPKKIFVVEITCDAKQSILGVRILDDYGKTISSSIEKFSQLNFKIKRFKDFF